MRGHIRQRSPGSYTVWLELPRVQGRRQQETFTFRGTRKEAEAKLAERISQIERGDYSAPEKMTFADVSARWLAARKPNLSARTYDRYDGICRDYLLPAFADLQIRKLTPLHVEDAIARWRTAKAKNRPGMLGPRTVHHIFTTLKTILAQAIRWNLIVRNACDAVTPPSKGHSEVRALNENAAQALLRGLAGSSLAAPVNVTLLTGLRRGELLGLKWDDVDLGRGTLHIQRSLEQLRDGACAFKDTKTRKSRRFVPLPTAAVEVLRSHKASQNATRLQSPSYNSQNMIFPEPASGEPWPPDRFSAAFYYRAHQLGIPVTFHGLRHTFATIALRADVPMKVVSEMLGHTSTGITADLYTHVFDDTQREATRRVSEAISRAKGA